MYSVLPGPAAKKIVDLAPKGRHVDTFNMVFVAVTSSTQSKRTIRVRMAIVLEVGSGSVIKKIEC
jgi:hypothetical protein